MQFVQPVPIIMTAPPSQVFIRVGDTYLNPGASTTSRLGATRSRSTSRTETSRSSCPAATWNSGSGRSRLRPRSHSRPRSHPRPRSRRRPSDGAAASRDRPTPRECLRSPLTASATPPDRRETSPASIAPQRAGQGHVTTPPGPSSAPSPRPSNDCTACRWIGTVRGGFPAIEPLGDVVADQQPEPVLRRRRVRAPTLLVLAAEKGIPPGERLRPDRLLAIGRQRAPVRIDPGSLGGLAGPLLRLSPLPVLLLPSPPLLLGRQAPGAVGRSLEPLGARRSRPGSTSRGSRPGSSRPACPSSPAASRRPRSSPRSAPPGGPPPARRRPPASRRGRSARDPGRWP